MIVPEQDNIPADKIHVRLATSPEEIAEAQRLRYKVFYEEYNAVADEKTAATKMDIDEFDSVTHHLVVVDEGLPVGQRIVGTYRLLRRDVAEKYGKFYTSAEFDIKPLLDSGTMLMELGRSCVLADYRTRAILQKLWQGIARYVDDHNIELMFGCGSLYGTNVGVLATQLSYLYHYHLAAPELRPVARENRYIEMNIIPKDQIDVKSAFMSLPPLIKGYLRIGATIGNGAVIDNQWNSTDVCIVMPTHLITEKYRNHYKRENLNAVRVERDLAERIAALEKESAL